MKNEKDTTPAFQTAIIVAIGATITLAGCIVIPKLFTKLFPKGQSL